MYNEGLSWGGIDANQLKLKVQGPSVEAVAEIKGGEIKVGMLIVMNKYSLEDVLTQLIDDYDKEDLIKRINEL